MKGHYWKVQLFTKQHNWQKRYNDVAIFIHTAFVDYQIVCITTDHFQVLCWKLFGKNFLPSYLLTNFHPHRMVISVEVILITRLKWTKKCFVKYFCLPSRCRSIIKKNSTKSIVIFVYYSCNPWLLVQTLFV